MENRNSCPAGVHERADKGFGLLSENLGMGLMYAVIVFGLIFGLTVVSQPQPVNMDCGDGIDNDGDGWIDRYDSGCYITNGLNETGGTECDDGIDNDGDGRVDWCPMNVNSSLECVPPRGDPECQITNGVSESIWCYDGMDNDGDGLVDMADPGCSITGRVSETGGTECDDGIDNDDDGWIDGPFNDFPVPAPYNDPGCLITDGASESGGTECDDGIDNDDDGAVDGEDTGCQVTGYNSEVGTTQCTDGIDNDGDSAIDLLDPGCNNNIWLDTEVSTICTDGIDNDGDSKTDYPDDPGCEGVWDADETDTACIDGIDNDGDTFVDMDDPGCMYPGDNNEYDPTPPPENVEVESSGSVGDQDGAPRVFWQDTITYTASFDINNPCPIDWVEIRIAPSQNPPPGGYSSHAMTDMGVDPANPNNHIYSYSYMPYPSHGLTQIEIFAHRIGCADTALDFPISIYYDPSGQVYDSVTGDPIVGATVTLYYENPPGSDTFVPAPTNALPYPIMSPDENPQTTDAAGHYGWDVIPGKYTVKVSAPGYYPNDDVRIVTIPPAVLDLNVYLTPNPECYDNDGDGYYGTTAECSTGTDCDDDDALINPGATEICGNDVDENCDETAPLCSCVDINPDTLNLKSNGQWITAYITLLEGYNVEDIDLATVKVDGISAEWSEIQNGVYMAKFDRAKVRDTLTSMIDYEDGVKFYDLTLTVTCEVAGQPFEGSDTITVIKK